MFPRHQALSSFPTRRSSDLLACAAAVLAYRRSDPVVSHESAAVMHDLPLLTETSALADRKSTRLNSSHVETSYAVFCLKTKSGARPNRRGEPARLDERKLLL